jgi:biopolymer transport protein TolR
MGLQVGSDGESDEGVLSQINVTPLVDVMLVLLVVFMITAPMLHQGIEVALPVAQAENLPARVEDPLILSVNRDGIVYLMDTPIHTAQLVDRLLPVLEARQEKSLFLKGDRDVPYGVIVEILDVLRQGGIVQIGMITEQPRTPPERRR